MHRLCTACGKDAIRKSVLKVSGDAIRKPVRADAIRTYVRAEPRWGGSCVYELGLISQGVCGRENTPTVASDYEMEVFSQGSF